MAAERLLDGEAEGLTRKAIELALQGDLGALRLCLDRVVPRRSARPLRMELPEIKNVGDVPLALARVVEAAAKGEIELEQANALAALVDKQRQALETRDLSGRVEELEMILENRGLTR